MKRPESQRVQKWKTDLLKKSQNMEGRTKKAERAEKRKLRRLEKQSGDPRD